MYISHCVDRLQDKAKKLEDIIDKELTERQDFTDNAEEVLNSLADLLKKLNDLVASIGPQVLDAKNTLAEFEVRLIKMDSDCIYINISVCL